MKILAIETSCDETAAAVSELIDGRHIIKSNIVASQIEFHQKYGGVVPEIASRKHIESITGVVEEAIKSAETTFGDVDAIAVTYAPGLIGALLVGVNYAKSLAFALNKPLIPVHHIEGHICANFICNPELKPPFLTLVVSGGHSSIVLVSDYNKYKTLARTRDDAAGEAFDKIARVLGLGYPGGPAVSKAAENGDTTSFKFPRTRFENSYDFSFSGLKTAVINELHKMEQRGEEINIADVSASFQEAVCDVLVGHLMDAARALGMDKLALAGGVAANKLLREKLIESAKHGNCRVFLPDLMYCTDNAAMIAARAQYSEISARNFNNLNAYAVKEL